MDAACHVQDHRLVALKLSGHDALLVEQPEGKDLELLTEILGEGTFGFTL
jgi:hypothetical protein